MDAIKKFNNGNWERKATSYTDNPNKTNKLVNNALRLLSMSRLKSVKNDVILMCNYVKDVVSGHYKSYSTIFLIKIIAALIYLVSPADAIPDFIFGVGFIDDATVLAYVFKATKEELERYKRSKTNSRHA